MFDVELKCSVCGQHLRFISNCSGRLHLDFDRFPPCPGCEEEARRDEEDKADWSEEIEALKGLVRDFGNQVRSLDERTDTLYQENDERFEALRDMVNKHRSEAAELRADIRETVAFLQRDHNNLCNSVSVLRKDHDSLVGAVSALCSATEIIGTIARNPGDKGTE